MSRRHCSATLGVIFALAALSACGGSVGGMESAVDTDRGAQTATYEYVVLVPRVIGGEGGWCMARPRAVFGPAACEEASGAGPILAENWGSVGSGQSAVANGVAITTSAVASVSVEGGEPIPTRSEPDLPGSLRTVSVEVRESARGKKLVEFVLRKARRRFTPLDSRGRALRQTGDEAVMSFKAPAVTWLSPETEPPGLCKITPSSADGLYAVGGTVATRVTSATNVPGEPLLSCIGVRYRAGSSRLIASVLINAHRPGAAPGPLPNAQAIEGRPGIYRALGADGAIVARRVPDAWLTVSGGNSQSQRVELLTGLHAAAGV
jgi:hypothetical protein